MNRWLEGIGTACQGELEVGRAWKAGGKTSLPVRCAARVGCLTSETEDREGHPYSLDAYRLEEVATSTKARTLLLPPRRTA